MNKIFISFLIGCTLFSIPTLKAQTRWEGYEHLATPVKTHVVYPTSQTFVIDGKANETDWEKVQWTTDFEDIEGGQMPKPLFRTRVKMLYDDANLYILAELEDPHIWATYDTRDMIIYHENDIEVFIDPDGDTHNYYEYELNAKNTLLDLKMPMPYRNGGKADIRWNSKAFQSAVSLDGTLNDPTDTDKMWRVEMKIPFADLEVQQVPSDGQIWKVNFSRVQWRIHVVDGKYQKIKDPATNRAYPEYNWVWSPPGLINMHYPERWGMIQFSDTKAGINTVQFIMPEKETAGKQLWLVYYKQQDFKRKNGRFAGNLKELGIAQNKEVGTINIDLKATTQQFTVQTILSDSSVISINETGLYLTKNTDQ